MPAENAIFRCKLLHTVFSFTKGLKKAGRAFEKRGKRVGASQRIKKNRGRVVSRIPNNHLSNSGKQMK